MVFFFGGWSLMATAWSEGRLRGIAAHLLYRTIDRSWDYVLPIANVLEEEVAIVARGQNRASVNRATWDRIIMSMLDEWERRASACYRIMLQQSFQLSPDSGGAVSSDDLGGSTLSQDSVLDAGAASSSRVPEGPPSKRARKGRPPKDSIDPAVASTIDLKQQRLAEIRASNRALRIQIQTLRHDAEVRPVEGWLPVQDLMQRALAAIREVDPAVDALVAMPLLQRRRRKWYNPPHVPADPQVLAKAAKDAYLLCRQQYHLNVSPALLERF